MRRSQSIYLISLLFILVYSSAFSQCPDGPGLFINEVYQDVASEVEWVEFVVAGDPDDPLAPVNLEGWLFDDNNGDFGDGSGLNQGVIGFGAFWNAAIPGSIIVIYNEHHRDPLLLPDDHLDGNNDGIYIIPANHLSLIHI